MFHNRDANEIYILEAGLNTSLDGHLNSHDKAFETGVCFKMFYTISPFETYSKITDRHRRVIVISLT